MSPIINIIERIKAEFSTAIQQASTGEALEQVRITFLSRNGHIAALMAQLKDLPVEEKRLVGPLLNDLRSFAESTYANKQHTLATQALEQQTRREQSFDVTASRATSLHGSKHIYTHIIERLEDIFIAMGYQIVEGPEVETEFNNFDALNIPTDHPARDSHDTFWLTLPGMLLRTHTSPVQIRALQNYQLPLAICAPGRVYRNEATDASHNFMFTQIEGLFVDKNVSMAHLLATVQTFLQAVFQKKDLAITARPSYFPFVEPGIEIDASCPFCKHGCSVCKKTGWIELMGAGLVHPNVLKACGIDPKVYSGFAFGMGLDRLAMIQHAINDIRLFQSSKVAFLDQF